jgi:ADP-ribosylglycohydrolase/Mg-chelatase subunit ChlD
MKAEQTLSIQLLAESLLLNAGATSKKVVEVCLTAPPKDSTGSRHPLNISLVLDRSGSMQGEKLESVKRAATYLIDQMAENDRVSVVTFDDEVTVIAESVLIDPSSREKLKRSVKAVKSGGSTNLSGGWLAGCEQVAQHLALEGGQINRTLLLTDGLANCGITGVEELAVHARALAERGVSTSTFGVGEGFSEQLLEVMATNGGGSFTFIVSPEDIPEIFAREFGEMMAISIRDVEVNIKIPEQAVMALLGSWRVERTGQNITRIYLGSLCGSEDKRVYFDLQTPPGIEGQQVHLDVTVRGRSDHNELLESCARLSFTYSSTQDIRAEPIDQSLLERAGLARVAHISTIALNLERKGQARQGSDMLFEAIMENKQYLDSSTLHTYESMAQKMKAGMNEGDRKQLHYQSYLHRSQRADERFQSRTHSQEVSSGLLLQQLLQDHTVRIQNNRILWQFPDPLPSTFTFDRVEGMLLGLAVGDSLGNTTESMLPAQRRLVVGEVTNYLANRNAEGRAVGLPSDDTQMAFWTLEVLLQDTRLDPDHLALRFTKEKIYGIGSTVKAFLRAYKDQGQGWMRSGQESAGNGAVMRIAPVLLPYLRRPSSDLWADAVLAGMVTHNDYASNAACAALVGMFWKLLAMQAVPPQRWWAETFFHIAGQLEGTEAYTPRMPGLTYRGPISRFVYQEVNHALKENWSTLQAADTWGSGAFLLETLPNVIYILTKYAGDPEQAVIRAVNDTKDNDTIAAIVGAAVGALHGKSALPERWITGLLGRTNGHNDGYIFRLIDEARQRFG